MKTFNILVILSLLMGITLFSSCDSSEDQPGPQDVYLQKLSSSWKVESVKVDGVSITDPFVNMILTFKSEMTYSVTNAVDPIWPSSGTFTLVEGTGELFNIKRSDEVLLTVRELSETRLVMSFPYTSSIDGGRSKSVSGQFEFVMTK
jgi:hypothetical protein